MLMSMMHRMGALIVANFIAAAAVGGMSLLAIWIVAIVSPGDAGLSSAIGGAFILGLIAAGVGFVVSFPFYLVGLIFVGIPTWWALHKTGKASAAAFQIAAALQSVLAGVIAFRLLAPGTELVAPLLVIPGTLAGRMLWRYGYKPVTPPPAPPS